jgi:hypothetical protein
VNDWSEIVTPETQTRVPLPGSVIAEGGGTDTPTLGGGIGFIRDTSTVYARPAVGSR